MCFIGAEVALQLLGYVVAMNPFPNKNLGNAGKETQVGAADRKDREE